MENGVNIYLKAGGDVRNMTMAITNNANSKPYLEK